MGVRESIQRAMAGQGSAAAKREKPPEYTTTHLYALKNSTFEPSFQENPELTVAYIRKTFARDVVANSYSAQREFVTDWFEKHGFSDKDAAEMRKRIDQHAEAEAK